jgi:hypothetical protein
MQCVILNISQPYRPPRPVTGIALPSFFFTWNVLPSKGKAVHVADPGGPYGCEPSRLLHFIDNQLTDGDQVVSLTRRPVALYLPERFRYSFLLEAVCLD